MKTIGIHQISFKKGDSRHIKSGKKWDYIYGNYEHLYVEFD
jgi:hypothetical protein